MNIPSPSFTPRQSTSLFARRPAPGTPGAQTLDSVRDGILKMGDRLEALDQHAADKAKEPGRVEVSDHQSLGTRFLNTFSLIQSDDSLTGSGTFHDGRALSFDIEQKDSAAHRRALYSETPDGGKSYALVVNGTYQAVRENPNGTLLFEFGELDQGQLPSLETLTAPKPWTENC